MMHEVTEGFLLGKKAIDMKCSIKAAVKKSVNQVVGAGDNARMIIQMVPVYPKDYKLYEEAHAGATKAPNEMNKKQSLIYKNIQQKE